LVGAATGVALTETVVVYIVDGEQPEIAVPLVTVSEYVLVTVGVAVGFSVVAEDKPGPLQANVVAPSAGLAVKFTVPPLQMYPLLVGAAEGGVLTVTVVV
jgi:hypothetical protein